MRKADKYSIRLEWKPDGGISYIGLKALSPRSPEEQGMLSLTSEMGDQIDYYFIHGENIDRCDQRLQDAYRKSPDNAEVGSRITGRAGKGTDRRLNFSML